MTKFRSAEGVDFSILTRARRRRVCEKLRAAYEGRDLPRLPEQKAPTRVTNAGEFAGTYATTDGKKLDLTADGETLLLNYAGQKIALERDGEDAFLVSHPDFSLFPLSFGRDQGKVVEAFYGGQWYAGEHYQGPRGFSYPPEWNSYPGHYRSNQAWFNNFRIVMRKGKLWLISPEGGEWAMAPDGQGGFWAGEEGQPPREQIRCDTVVHGNTLRCILSGQGYYRTFTP